MQVCAFCDWLQWVLYSPLELANGYEYVYEEALRFMRDPRDPFRYAPTWA
jgi:hypothetical protein